MQRSIGISDADTAGALQHEQTSGAVSRSADKGGLFETFDDWLQRQVLPLQPVRLRAGARASDDQVGGNNGHDSQSDESGDKQALPRHFASRVASEAARGR